MFAARYFAPRYFAPRYWPKVGSGTAASSDLRAGLNTYLRAQSGIVALVGNRIRPGFRPQVETLPALTYTVIDNPRLHGLSGVNAQAVARVQFDCWGSTLADCVSIKRALEVALDGYSGDLGGVACKWARQVSERDLHEEPKDASDRWVYRITVDYHLKHVSPAP